MKSSMYFLILEFIQLQCTVSFYINKSKNFESYSLFPISNIRIKRSQADYMRWRDDLEPAPEEFIVKVLDDDVTTTETTPIVAINVLQDKKSQEKIIVDGAIVPSKTQKIQENEIAKVYTRFIAPTTNIAQIKEEFLTPVTHININNDNLDPEPRAPYGIRQNSLRADMHPPSPQFLPRTPILLARQYAPVTPVLFTKSVASSRFSINEILRPTRTSELTFLPIRAKSDNGLTIMDSLIDESDIYYSQHDLLTRSTLIIAQSPLRSTISIKSDEFYGLPEFESKIDDTGDNKEINKNSDISYNSMSKNDEYIEGKSKNLEQGSGDTYDDKNEFSNEEPDAESTRLEKLENITAMIDHSYTEDDELENITDISSPKKDTKIESKASKFTTNVKHKDRLHPICNLLKFRQLNFNSPRTLPEIVAQLKQWAEGSPVAKWTDITNGNYTTMENPIYLIIVDDPSSGQIISAKQTVMLVAGIQGRDHHAVAAAMYVLYQLIERSEAHVDLLTKYRFWIIPVFNPDGYEYSMTFPFRRSWIKNLKQSWDMCKGRESCYVCENYGLRCTVQPCYGVNLDRNFEYQWIPAEELRSEHPCGDLFAGTRQLSETETRALTHFLHEQRSPLYTFIAFKEGDILGVMYPYSHTRKKRAFDHVYRQRASRAAAAAFSISGRPYVAGQTSEFLPLYAGGIEDWVDGHLGIDNTYTIMMFRHTDAYNTKLITERVVHEAYAAMDTLLLQSAEPTDPGVVKLVRANNAVILHCLNSITLNIIAILLFNQ